MQQQICSGNDESSLTQPLHESFQRASDEWRKMLSQKWLAFRNVMFFGVGRFHVETRWCVFKNEIPFHIIVRDRLGRNSSISRKHKKIAGERKNSKEFLERRWKKTNWQIVLQIFCVCVCVLSLRRSCGVLQWQHRKEWRNLTIWYFYTWEIIWGSFYDDYAKKLQNYAGLTLHL